MKSIALRISHQVCAFASRHLLLLSLVFLAVAVVLFTSEMEYARMVAKAPRQTPVPLPLPELLKFAATLVSLVGAILTFVWSLEVSALSFLDD